MSARTADEAALYAAMMGRPYLPPTSNARPLSLPAEAFGVAIGVLPPPKPKPFASDPRVLAARLKVLAEAQPSAGEGYSPEAIANVVAESVRAKLESDAAIIAELDRAVGK